jgi:hypothetical protein
MEHPIQLNDTELAAVAGGVNGPSMPSISVRVRNSLNNNFASFANNSNNNSFNGSFNTILSGNTIELGAV